jgi:hypothetical protein
MNSATRTRGGGRVAEFETYEEEAAKRKHQCSETGVFVVAVVEQRDSSSRLGLPERDHDPDVLNDVRVLGVGVSLRAALGLVKEWWQGAPRAVKGQLPPTQLYRIVLMDISPDDGRGEISEA